VTKALRGHNRPGGRSSGPRLRPAFVAYGQVCVHSGKFTCVPDSDNCTTEFDAVVVGVESTRTEVIAHADPGYFSMDVSWQPRR